MDEILQRMLAVEKQAETILNDAGKEAESLLVTARRAAAAEEERLKREAISAVETLVQTRIQAAESRKTAALEATVSALKNIENDLRRKTTAAVTMVFRELSYPQSSVKSAADKPR